MRPFVRISSLRRLRVVPSLSPGSDPFDAEKALKSCTPSRTRADALIAVRSIGLKTGQQYGLVNGSASPSRMRYS